MSPDIVPPIVKTALVMCGLMAGALSCHGGGQGQRDELSVVGVEECTPGERAAWSSPAPGR